MTYEELMLVCNEYDQSISEEIKRYQNEKSNTKSDNDKKAGKIMVFVIFISIVLGLILGEFVFVSERKGANTICYTTTYGNHYHASYCGSLYASRHKTTVYDAKKNGYYDCSKCSVGTLDTSYKHHYGLSILGSFSILSLVSLCLYYKKANALIDLINQAHETKKEELFNIYSDKILKQLSDETILTIAGAPNHIFLENNEIKSTRENLYKYISYSGRCYHDYAGCSGSYYGKVFKYELKGYRPCRKCGSSIVIPEWYTKYKTLRELKHRFQQ